MIELETERLVICLASDAQIAALIAGLKDSDPELSQAYQEMLEGCLSHPEGRVWYAPWMFYLKSTREEVGDACFKGLSADGRVEIGYGLHEEHWGRGYATEGVQALCRWAFGQEGVTAIEAETEPDNLASQRVLRKCGFVPTGQMGEEGPRFVLRKEESTK